MEKILILYATAGIGHKKAALAIKESFDEKNIKDVLLKDVLDYTNPFFKISYGAIYLFLVKYVPTLWGFFYYILDNPLIYAILKPLRRLTNYINSKKLVKFLLETKPNTVIVTHFLPSEVISHLKKKGIFNTNLISVITDYESHIFWLSEYVDTYVVASDYTKEDLIKRGIPKGRIMPFGIPCAKAFSRKHDRNLLRSRIGLDPHKMTVFILGGGFGVGPIKGITVFLDKLEEDFQGIVVCGYNKTLYNEIKNISQSTTHSFKVYGFVENIDELMAASDVLISKSGGITVTESLNSGLPMIVVDPIPGQEMRNFKFLEKNNAALKIKNVKDITNVMKDLLNVDTARILKDNIEKIRRIGSAERIVDYAKRNG